MKWRTFYQIDFRILPIILALMVAGLAVIAATDTVMEGAIEVPDTFFTPRVRGQLLWYLVGWGVFFLFAAIDYAKIREWTWGIYLVTLIALVGLFFVPAVQNVHRWFRLPGVPIAIQPSEWAKLVVVIALSWYLEKRRSQSLSPSTAFFSCLIVGVPFLLILKQPDLGTAMVLFPISLTLFYFGDLHPWVIKVMVGMGILGVFIVSLFFLGIIPHEEFRPYATRVIKEYQYERLNPDTHHQQASLTAIALGGLTGTGWKEGEYTGHGWLPAAATDSVFSAFGEEFGVLGLLVLMGLFYALIYFSFQVTAAAKDEFGRLLAAGITVYLSMHILCNMGMMTGFLPITGVPLLLVTYGGSSVVVTMAALGILQSIYSRRFMF